MGVGLGAWVGHGFVSWVCWHYPENRSNPSFKADAVKRCMFPEVFSARRLTQTLGFYLHLQWELLNTPYVCQKEHVAFHMGTAIGDGECVALVKHCAGAPETSKWKQGASVRGNVAIQSGTAIATFKDGKYPNQRHGNHAAIYISQDAKGIQVYDQWSGKGVHTRTIRWSGGGGEDPSDDGNAFSIIE